MTAPSETSLRVASARSGGAALLPGLAFTIAGALLARLIAAPFDAISALVVAVVLGAVAGNVGLVTTRLEPGVTFSAKKILRLGVVLLGLRLSLGDVFDVGGPGLATIIATVTITFFGTQWIGRRLGLGPDLSLLVATGFSICGASAIAAVEGSTDASEEEVAAAIGLVTLFGSMAIVVIPALSSLLGLDDTKFGAWSGASVHDVAQVVATASSRDVAGAVTIAIVVKLTRVVLLAPIVAGVNLARRRDVGGSAPILPLFVVGFLAMVALRTTGVLPQGVLDAVKEVENFALAMALVGLGAGVRVDKLRKLGVTPLLLGAISWVLVAAVSLVGVELFF